MVRAWTRANAEAGGPRPTDRYAEAVRVVNTRDVQNKGTTVMTSAIRSRC